MKSRLFSVLALVFVAVGFLCWPSLAPAADSTSFNPTTVQVQAEAPGGYPIGFIGIWLVGQDPPEPHKWLECDGQPINASVYPELRTLMGPTVPNLQGLFLRGRGEQTYSQNNGSSVGITPTTHRSGALGQIQGDALRNLTGSLTASTSGGNQQFLTDVGSPLVETGALYVSGTSRQRTIGNNSLVYISPSGIAFDASRILPTATENRPANMAVRYLVRALK